MLSNDIKSYLDTYYEEMLKLLERLVNIDSGSACKEGIDRVATIMAREYEKEGFEVEIVMNYKMHREGEGNGNPLQYS